MRSTLFTQDGMPARSLRLWIQKCTSGDSQIPRSPSHSPSMTGGLFSPFLGKLYERRGWFIVGFTEGCFKHHLKMSLKGDTQLSTWHDANHWTRAAATCERWIKMKRGGRSQMVGCSSEDHPKGDPMIQFPHRVGAVLPPLAPRGSSWIILNFLVFQQSNMARKSNIAMIFTSCKPSP